MVQFESASPHFMPWLVFLGVLWSSIVIEIAGVKAYLGVGWFRALLPTALLAGLAPALYLAIALKGSAQFPIGAQGVTVTPYAFARPFTVPFFALCVGIGLVAGIIKCVLLRRFSRPGKGFAILLVLFSTLAATAAISEMTLDSRRLVATVMRMAGVSARQVAGDRDPSLNPLKNAQPLMDYYKKLGESQKKNE